MSTAKWTDVTGDGICAGMVASAHHYPIAQVEVLRGISIDIEAEAVAGLGVAHTPQFIPHLTHRFQDFEANHDMERFCPGLRTHLSRDVPSPTCRLPSLHRIHRTMQILAVFINRTCHEESDLRT